MHLTFSKTGFERPAVSYRSVIELALLLLVLNLVVFSQVVKFNFLIWDDEFYVLPHLMREGGLTPNSVRWALTNQEAGWIAPLPYLSFFVDLEIYGLHSAGFHFTNLLIHIANTWLLLLFAIRTTGQLWPSFGLAVLFALHPLHVEPVVWVTCRWELLCGFFWMLGLLAYLRYCRTQSRLAYAAICIAFLCSLLSKPMALTFPFVLVLLDLWPLRRLVWEASGQTTSAGAAWARSAADSVSVELCPAATSRSPSTGLDGASGTWWTEMRQGLSAVGRSIAEKWLLFLIMVVHLSLALIAKNRFIASKGQIPFSISDRVANSFETWAIYAVQFFWPTSLNFYYPHPALQNTWVPGRYLWALLLLVLVSVFACVLIRRQPWFFVGWFWYLGVFVPAIGWIQVEEQSRANRYTYLPLIGLALAVCWSAEKQLSQRWQPFLVRWLATTLLVVTLIPISWREASYWRDSQTLMTRGVTVDPKNFKAWFNLGHLAIREQNLDLAESYFRSALKVYDASRSNYLLGHVLVLKGQYAEAIPFLRAALGHNPNYSRAQVDLAQALRGSGEEEAAKREYQSLATRFPNDPSALTHYAHYRLSQGDYAEAIRVYQRVMQLAPTADRIGNFLGQAFEASGDGAEAVAFYDRYTARFPIRTDLANRAAWILATHADHQVRNGAEAVRRAERLNQETRFTNRFMLDTLAAAYAETGEFARAIEVAERAQSIADQEGDTMQATALKQRIALYLRKEPFREPATLPVAKGGSATSK